MAAAPETEAYAGYMPVIVRQARRHTVIRDRTLDEEPAGAQGQRGGQLIFRANARGPRVLPVLADG